MSKAFGWCFIGCGKLAGIVAKEIGKSKRHRVVSVYGRSRDKCLDFTREHGGVAYSSARAAITAPGVEGVYVVTPHASHYEYAKLALELGKPVLCEKAFTVTAAQARELIDLAREKHLYLAEAMWTWFAPVPNAVKRWLDAGEFGTIRDVKLRCHALSERYAPRVTDPKAAGGGLLDMGVYAVTYLYRLFGKPVKVECTGRVAQGIDWEEEIALTFPSGARYTTGVSITDMKGALGFSITGTRASVAFKGFYTAGKAVLKRTHGAEETAQGKCSYLNEFDIVASEIREGLLESRYVPQQATLDVMEILDECRRQMGLVYPFERAPGREVDRGRLSVLTFPLDMDPRLSPEEVVSTVAQAGLTQVDLMDIPPEKVPAYLTALDRHGMEALCAIAHVSFFQGEDVLTKGLKEASDTARRLGAKLLMIVPFSGAGDFKKARKLGREAVRERLVAGFQQAVEWAYACGLTACFETTPQEEMCLSGVEDCRFILDRVHGLGLVFDTANVLAHGDGTLEALEALRDRIVHVHLKDVELLDKAPGRYKERTADGKFMRCVLWGDGVIPIREVYDRLSASGYEGTFAIEYARPLGPDRGLPGHRDQLERFVEYLERAE